MRPCKGLVLALLLVGSPRAGRAEDPRELARQLVVEGNQLLTNGACALALTRFERAKTLYPASFKIEVNLGSAKECLGELPAAAEHFERFLKRADLGKLPEMVGGIVAKLEGLRKKLARITLNCSADGAEVHIDGKLIGKTPLEYEPYLMPGAHRFIVRKAGQLPLDRQLKVSAGDRIEIIVPWGLVPVVRPASQPASISVAPPDTSDEPASRTPPVYKRWWFWTVIGVAVAGAVTAGVVATQVGGSDRLPAGALGNMSLE